MSPDRWLPRPPLHSDQGLDAYAPAAMVAGQRDPASLAADGSASWSGPVADAFVGTARLA